MRILGFDQEGIRNMTREAFEKFWRVRKQFQDLLIQNTQVIICTCDFAKQQCIQNKKIRRVIIDEAT